jgi:hypothetical protein
MRAKYWVEVEVVKILLANIADVNTQDKKYSQDYEYPKKQTYIQIVHFFQNKHTEFVG